MILLLLLDGAFLFKKRMTILWNLPDPYEKNILETSSRLKKQGRMSLKLLFMIFLNSIDIDDINSTNVEFVNKKRPTRSIQIGKQTTEVKSFRIEVIVHTILP